MTLSILLTFFGSLIALPDTSIHTTVEAQAIVADAGLTPFWIRSLQYGSVPMENPGLVLRAWNGKGYNLKKKYDWKYEVEATGWTGKQNDFWLTQAYISGRRGKWEIWAGRRKEVYGLGDTTMTGGFYAWSGNAMPMPKIQLGTRDYLNFAKGWLGVHMTYSHGWFDNQGPTINGYLHQKTLYGRLGKINSTINLFGGINHNVDWGGESKVKKGGDFDYYPSGLNTYFYVVTVLKDRTIIATDPNSSWDDLGYQFGNHLGSIDLALKFQNNYFDLLLYRQSMYETGRIASLAIINDGLNGISLKLKKNNLVKNIGLEYLYTANQGNYTSGISSYLGIIDSHKIEIETYMNNGARGSWKYWNKTLGTPIFILESDRGPKYTGKNFGLTAIKSFHFYVSGEVTKTLFWQIRTSLGSYASARNHLMPRLAKEDFISQNSVYLGLEKKINQRIQSKINFSFDSGKMIRNSSGFSLSVKYIFPNGKM